jgi:DNA-binding NarL/FixJ family response regulator
MPHVVVIADDPATVRANRFTLRQAAGFQVLATLDGRATVRERIAELQPDVVLVTEMCQRTNVAARIRETAQAAPGCRVLLLSSRANAAADAVAAGADGVLPAGLPPAALAALLGPPARDRGARPAGPPAGGEATLRLVGAQDAPAARTSA